MSRPLQLDSIFDLNAVAERNRDNKAELELIRSELHYLSTAAALKPANDIEPYGWGDDLCAGVLSCNEMLVRLFRLIPEWTEAT